MRGKHGCAVTGLNSALNWIQFNPNKKFKHYAANWQRHTRPCCRQSVLSVFFSITVQILSLSLFWSSTQYKSTGIVVESNFSLQAKQTTVSDGHRWQPFRGKPNICLATKSSICHIDSDPNLPMLCCSVMFPWGIIYSCRKSPPSAMMNYGWRLYALKNL